MILIFDRNLTLFQPSNFVLNCFILCDSRTDWRNFITLSHYFSYREAYLNSLVSPNHEDSDDHLDFGEKNDFYFKL